MNNPLRDQSDDAILYLSHHAPSCFQDEIDAEMARRITERLPCLSRTTSQTVNMAKNMPRNRFYWLIRLCVGVGAGVGAGLLCAIIMEIAIWAVQVMK